MKMLKALLNWRMLVVTLMGFASGLPLALVGQTLKAWATDAGWTLGAIGTLSILSAPYSYKFLIAPLLDYYIPPYLGRRRGWLFVLQIGLFLSIFGLSMINPSTEVTMFMILGFSVATFSAIQDIAIDAYRREILTEEEFGLGVSLAVSGYRIAMYVSQAVALILADHMNWSAVYQIMACVSLIGLATTVFTKEPTVEKIQSKSIVQGFVEPFKELISRKGIAWVLAFVLFYKLGDAMASQMTMPLYLKIGFSKTEVAAIVKSFGIGAIIAGGLLGGAIILRIGLLKSLWIFGFLQAISTVAFAWLAHVGHDLGALTAIISFENLAAGMGSAAYTAFMAKMSNKKYTATQYAVLTSIMGFTMSFMGVPTGFMAEALGWDGFFITCGLIGIPGMLLLLKIGRWADTPHDDGTAPVEAQAPQPN